MTVCPSKKSKTSWLLHWQVTPWKYGTALSVHISTFDFYAVPLLAFKSILLRHPMVKNARMKLHKTSSTRLYMLFEIEQKQFFVVLGASERAFLFMYYSRLDTWRARAYNLHTSIDRQLEIPSYKGPFMPRLSVLQIATFFILLNLSRVVLRL